MNTTELDEVRRGLLTPAPMPNEPGVPYVAEPQCAGRWELFDSIDPGDHLEAALICADCPVSAWCADQLEAAAALAPVDGFVVGTWAGQLYTPTTRDYCHSCGVAMTPRQVDPPAAGEARKATRGTCRRCYDAQRYAEGAR